MGGECAPCGFEFLTSTRMSTRHAWRRALPSEDAFQGGYCYTDCYVRQEAVVNPVAGEADYQVEVLHGTNIVPRRWALGPIGLHPGLRGISPGTFLVGNLLETMYPIWDKVIQRERLRAWYLRALGEKKPHRNRSCEVTVAPVSDAVRPRRARILASFRTKPQLRPASYCSSSESRTGLKPLDP